VNSDITTAESLLIVSDQEISNMPLDMCISDRIKMYTYTGRNDSRYLRIKCLQGKKSGISLNVMQCLSFVDTLRLIHDDMQDLAKGANISSKYHIGKHSYVTINSPYKGLNIRCWYRPLPTDDLRTGYGVFLNMREWKEMECVLRVLHDFIPEMSNMEPCSNTHDAQLSALACTHCNPDTLFYEYL
jgi:hypothetical protein